MGDDGKDFSSGDRVPQAEDNQASGPWGAVPTSRDKEEGWVWASFLSISETQDVGEKAMPTGSRVEGAPHLAGSVLPSRSWTPVM